MASKTTAKIVAELEERGFRFESEIVVEQCERIIMMCNWSVPIFIAKYETFAIANSFYKMDNNSICTITLLAMTNFILELSKMFEKQLQQTGASVFSITTVDQLKNLTQTMLSSYKPVSETLSLPDDLVETNLTTRKPGTYKIKNTYGGNVARMVNTKIVKVVALAIQEPYFSMNVHYSEITNAIIRRVKFMMTWYQQEYKNKFMDMPWMSTEMFSHDDAIIIGRIIMREDNKLFLEISKDDEATTPNYLFLPDSSSKDKQIKIQERSDLPLLLNGMIIGIRGSITPNIIKATEFLELPPLEQRCKLDTFSAMKISVFKGPFLDVDDGFLLELLAHTKRESANVLILLGPFVTDRYLPVKYIEIEISNYLEKEEFTNLQVVIVPSPEDFFVLPIFPQASPTYNINLDITINKPNIHWVSNPAILLINNVEFFLTSIDLIHLLRTCAINEGPNPNNDRLIKTVLRQRSILPIYPTPYDITYDLAGNTNVINLTTAPHFLIYGSTTGHTSRIDETMVVSPGSIIYDEDETRCLGINVADITINNGIRVDLSEITLD